MIAICWHFAYGVWLFAAKWGITPGVKARKRFGYVCVALGVRAAPCWDWPASGPLSGRMYPNAPEIDRSPRVARSGLRQAAWLATALDYKLTRLRLKGR